MQTSVFIVLAAGSVYLLSFLFIVNPFKRNKLANTWLGIFYFTYGNALLSKVAQQGIATPAQLWLMHFSEVTRFAMAPAMYISVKAFVTPNWNVSRSTVAHFIPAFLFLIILGLGNLEDLNLPMPLMIALPTVVAVSIKLQLIIYWLLTYVLLIRHQRNTGVFAATPELVDLRWLKSFLQVLVVILVLWLAGLIFQAQYYRVFSDLLTLVLVYSLSYYAFQQKQIYSTVKEENVSIKLAIDDSTVQSKRHERVAKDKIPVLKGQLVSKMENDRMFLNPELDLPVLARSIDISPHELSYVLNEGFSMSFFEFVNHYRVEEAKRLLLSDEYRHLSLLGIAYEAGFNSKTTFNNNFKKATGLSPSAFQKQNKPN
jgi:AraC-like DNA-binding protein